MRYVPWLAILVVTSAAAAHAQSLSDDAIREAMIAGSIASYTGNCPCPYNTMRNGRLCAGHSAYSKPGGAEPLCYPRDISDDMVEKYRARIGR